MVRAASTARFAGSYNVDIAEGVRTAGHVTNARWSENALSTFCVNDLSNHKIIGSAQYLVYTCCVSDSCSQRVRARSFQSPDIYHHLCVFWRLQAHSLPLCRFLSRPACRAGFFVPAAAVAV